MVVFKYRAADRNGRPRDGQVEARSKEEARMKLARRRLRLYSIKAEAGSDSDGGDEIRPILGEYVYLDASGMLQFSFKNQQPKRRDVIVFTKQFSTMLSSGVPMVQALGTLAKQQQARGFRKVLRKVQSTVENGATLSHAMAAHAKIFDRLYVAMVEAGEASGNLDTILLKVVSYMERSQKIKGQVKSALVYPVMVLMVAIIVVTGLLVFVVPMFAQQYSDNGQTLPDLTQVVIDLSNLVVDNWYLLLGGMGGLTFAFAATVQTPRGRFLADRAILKAPIIGSVLQKIAIARFCSTMASMLSSGVNLLEALTICAASAGNKTIEVFILGLRRALEKGEKLSEPLGKGGLFPEMVVSMVAVGEATGAIDDMLLKVSEFYEEEVDLAVQTMLSMIEPIMIIVVGGIVGFIVIAMYLPVFEMAGSIT